VNADKVGERAGMIARSRAVLPGALRHGPSAAALASVAVSPVGYAAVAALLERRVLRPSTEYAALLCGDPLLALSVALGVRQLRGRFPAGLAGQPFGTASMVGWLGFGLCQWRAEVLSGHYTRAQALAPTKIWHQLVVYPVLGYWTWTACVGGLLAGDSTENPATQIAAKAGIAACMLGWLLANAYDRNHPKLGHPPYNWRTLCSEPRPWLAQSASLRAYLRQTGTPPENLSAPPVRYPPVTSATWLAATIPLRARPR
jgi:hypothetical protein